MTTDMRAIEKFGVIVAVREGVLLCTPIPEEGHDPEDWTEVTAPESQEFLDAVNAEFGTGFTMDQFAGR